MHIVVAIVVFNRFANIQRWVECWKQCEQHGAELVIIHNHYGDQVEKNRYKKYCDDHTVTYVSRATSGFDIGAFQDVCRNRLPGFPDYDYLLWCCDDTIPMQKDFIKPFIDTLLWEIYNDDRIPGIACMQIASSVKGEIHVRTTGFMIRKETAEKLKFPVDPVKTKQDCYLFEHKGGINTLTNQVRSMGLSCEQVAPKSDSPLWDMGYWKRLDRQAEHERIFSNGKTLNDKVVFICPMFEMYPQIISSLICQTHKNWELLLIYNGPCDNNLRDIVKSYEDSRVTFIEYPEQTGHWGHPLRQWALNEIAQGRLSDADYVVITNCDNYYVPSFAEYMLKGFKTHTAVATYCDSMTHSYLFWNNLPVKLALGFIDCGGVMVKKDIACEIGWRDIYSHSSDWTYFSDIAERYNSKNFLPVKGNLFIHN